jgi:hypothetical protein
VSHAYAPALKRKKMVDKEKKIKAERASALLFSAAVAPEADVFTEASALKNWMALTATPTAA